MADLTEQQSSQAVKITGANSSGVETNYVDADANGNMKVIAYDQVLYDDIALTYDSNQNLSTVIYKLATVAQKTLTLTYDSNQNLTDVAKS